MLVKTMCAAISPILNKIFNHPFNVELANGSLSRDKFIFYIQQDALYLADFSRALSITAGRLEYNLHQKQLVQFSIDAIKAEEELHANYIQQYQPLTMASKNPACFMYSNYLLRMASLNSPEEAIASLLPCFLIYHKVGIKMLASLYPTHPYYDWISLYSSVAFEASVDSMIEITNELGNFASMHSQKKMIVAFVQATQLEWLFWDDAYHKKLWPN